MTELEALYRAGFRDFVHLRKESRDSKKRISWTGVLNGNLFTVRVVENATGWQVDYVSPDKKEAILPLLARCSVTELLDFLAPLR